MSEDRNRPFDEDSGCYPPLNMHFEPKMYVQALHRQVLVVARTRIDGTWKAYIFPVPGNSHEDEKHLWRTEGAQLRESTARELFGHMEDIPYSS